MHKIGFVDLDTSHPRSFARRINALEEFQVTGVFDRGRVKGPQETEAFCREFGAVAYASAADLAEACDGVMVLSADWETHYADMAACLLAGTPCYADKPLVGGIEEGEKLLALCAQTETPMFGGSGWRWNRKVQDAQDKWRRDKVENVLITVPNERFYYGIHGVELLLGLLGPGVTWVQAERAGDNFTVAGFGHRCGTIGRLVLELPSNKLSRFNSFTVGDELQSVVFAGDDVHQGICATFARMVKTGEAPAAPGEMLESVHVALAIEESIETGSRVRMADRRRVREIGSASFMAEYGRNKG